MRLRYYGGPPADGEEIPDVGDVLYVSEVTDADGAALLTGAIYLIHATKPVRGGDGGDLWVYVERGHVGHLPGGRLAPEGATYFPVSRRRR